jgi:tetratricopeptide (TPR) repeat protein
LDAVRSQQQQLDLAQDLANDAMHMYKRLGDRVGEAHCLNGLGLAAIDAGRSDEAEELLKTTVAICEETRDAQAREVFLLNMGVVCLDRGDWARARDIFAENLSFARANHDDLDVAMSSENLWEAHLIGGEPLAGRAMSVISPPSGCTHQVSEYVKYPTPVSQSRQVVGNLKGLDLHRCASLRFRT